MAAEFDTILAEMPADGSRFVDYLTDHVPVVLDRVGPPIDGGQPAERSTQSLLVRAGSIAAHAN